MRGCVSKVLCHDVEEVSVVTLTQHCYQHWQPFQDYLLG
jgi:hypothetical protein